MTGDDVQTSPEAGGSWQFKPGDTVSANTATATTPSSTLPHKAAAPSEDDAPIQNGPMRLANTAEQTVPAGVIEHDLPEETIDWTASEFIAHHKNAGWYLTLLLATVVLAGLVFLFTRDKISTVVVLVAAIIFAIYAARKPRTLSYQLGARGLRIGEKFYDFSQFRSFAVVDEGAFSSVVFMPMQRFMPMLTIYYDPADEAKIVQILADRLPMENHSHDLVERFLRRIRF